MSSKFQVQSSSYVVQSFNLLIFNVHRILLFNVRHINVTAKDTALMIIVGYPLPLALANGHEIFILLGL
jgi:hypothetical protein